MLKATSAPTKTLDNSRQSLSDRAMVFCTLGRTSGLLLDCERLRTVSNVPTPTECVWNLRDTGSWHWMYTTSDTQLPKGDRTMAHGVWCHGFDFAHDNRDDFPFSPSTRCAALGLTTNQPPHPDFYNVFCGRIHACPDALTPSLTFTTKLNYQDLSGEI